MRAVLPAGLVLLSTAGCATSDEVRYGNVSAMPSAYEASTYTVQQPLSLGEIVAALRAGRSSHEIAGEVDERGVLAPVTSADIDLLLQSGADAELIDAVQEASSASLAGRGTVPASPPIIASPPVIVTPPMYQSYGWYPYAPYAPYSFEFWYHDVPRYRAPRFRHDHRHDHRWRPDHDRGRPGAQQRWQSPRVSPAPVPGTRDSIRPGGSPRMSPGASPGATPRASPGASSGASPRATPQAPSSGAVRGRRVIE